MHNAMLRMLGVAALVGSAGCLPTYQPSDPNTKSPTEEGGIDRSGGTSTEPVAVRPTTPESSSTTFTAAGDPFVLAERAKDEGPLEVASSKHSCMKMKYDTLGRIMMNRGVNMGTLPVTLATNCAALQVGNPVLVSQPARFVYCDSRLTLGYPQYEGRLAEATSATTASATKLMDLFLSAGSEISANLANAAVCRNAQGQAAALFNNPTDQGTITCAESGFTCLQGYPASQDQLDLCTRVVRQGQATPAMSGAAAVTALENGKRLAVATVLSAAHSCE